MVDGGIKSESEGISSVDVHSLGAVANKAPDIASQILGVQVRHGRIHIPRGLVDATDVLPGRILGRAHRELLEDVVGRHGVSREEPQDKVENSLHC